MANAIRGIPVQVEVRRMRNARLLFVCGGTTVYGLERAVLRMMAGLADAGYDLRCVASGWNDGTFPRELERIGVPYRLVKLGWIYISRPDWTLDSLVHLPGGLRAYARALRETQPDLVLHSSYRTLIIAGWMSAGRNVAIVQDYWSEREGMLVRRADRLVAAYVPCSDDLLAHLRSLGLPAHKLHRIYNPVEFGATLRKRPPARPRSVTTLGIVGQVIERKGHRVVLEALAKLRARDPGLHFRLRIYGGETTDEAERVRATIAQRGLADAVEWCGYKADQDEIYPELDFTLVPTITPEPLGLAAIEPSVYGLPSITSTAGGLAEIVLEGLTGFQVPPADAETLADRISILLTKPALIPEMGERAYSENKRRFDTPLVISQFIELVESLR